MDEFHESNCVSMSLQGLQGVQFMYRADNLRTHKLASEGYEQIIDIRRSKEVKHACFPSLLLTPFSSRYAKVTIPEQTFQSRHVNSCVQCFTHVHHLEKCNASEDSCSKTASRRNSVGSVGGRRSGGAGATAGCSEARVCAIAALSGGARGRRG
jgi:hypothetical protein